MEKDLRKTTLPLAGGIVVGEGRTMMNSQAELHPFAIFKKEFLSISSEPTRLKVHLVGSEGGDFAIPIELSEEVHQTVFSV